MTTEIDRRERCICAITFEEVDGKRLKIIVNTEIQSEVEDIMNKLGYGCRNYRLAFGLTEFPY